MYNKRGGGRQGIVSNLNLISSKTIEQLKYEKLMQMVIYFTLLKSLKKPNIK